MLLEWFINKESDLDFWGLIDWWGLGYNSLDGQVQRLAYKNLLRVLSMELLIRYQPDVIVLHRHT
jgi:hypothetical protein